MAILRVLSLASCLAAICGQTSAAVAGKNAAASSSGVEQLLDRVLALERELESVTAKYARLESLIGEVLDAQDVRKNLGGLGRAAASSCETLKAAGHLAPGYYWVDGPGGVNFELVFCDMSLQPDEPGFQEPTSVAQAEYPVAFDGYNPHHDTNYPSLIHFDTVLLNEGGALDTDSGAITIPLDGIYHFAFFCNEHPSAPAVSIDVRVNGAVIGVIEASGGADDLSVLSATVLLSLDAGDSVGFYATSGSFYSQDHSHVTGRLVHVYPSGWPKTSSKLLDDQQAFPEGQENSLN